MEPTSTPETQSDALEDDDLEAPRLGMLIVAAVVALAIGGMAGFAIGFKVEQNRIKSQSKSKQDKAAQQAQGAKKKAQPVGTVSEVSPTSLTIKTSGGKQKVVSISSATVVDKASGGGATDITQGATVIVQGKNASGGFEATEIIVLPPGTKFAPAES